MEDESKASIGLFYITGMLPKLKASKVNVKSHIEETQNGKKTKLR